MTARRVGLLGGTFDPIHRGHLDAACAAEAALDLESVFVITSHVPPHRAHPSASSYHRFAMAALAVRGKSTWRALDVELRHAAPSYTAATLRRFHEREYAPADLFFIIGADAFAEIETWRDYPALLELCRFAVVSRPGHPASELTRRMPQLAARMTRTPLDLRPDGPSIVLVDAPTADVSSTAIRERRARGQSIGGLVPEAVQQHIEQHGLYIPSRPGRRIGDHE
jgi:nicotinate-nucleotide adenylyltransferase